MWRQAVAALATIAYSVILTFVIAWIIQKTVGLRMSAEAEWDGGDEAEHAESAYELSALNGRHITGGTAQLAREQEMPSQAAVSARRS